jgi:hypothetical protein
MAKNPKINASALLRRAILMKFARYINALLLYSRLIYADKKNLTQSTNH